MWSVITPNPLYCQKYGIYGDNEMHVFKGDQEI